METIWDWITIAIFAGLTVLLLQRSVAEEPRDKMIEYLPAAVGCALANYLGNHEQPLFAAVIVVAVLAYTWFVLKPLEK